MVGNPLILKPSQHSLHNEVFGGVMCVDIED